MLAVAVEVQPDFRVAPDHGERGSQLVGDLGEELGPGAGGSASASSARLRSLTSREAVWRRTTSPLRRVSAP